MDIKNNKAKFVRLDMTRTIGDERYSWTEWFCLATTWTHPYNRKDAMAKAHQAWCEWQLEKGADWSDSGYECCPNITIGGAPLQDGWGSDIDSRVCGDLPCREWGDKVEEALATGEVQTLRLASENEVLETTFTPFKSITPDPESVASFGPFAEAALEGLVEK